ncbi:copper resistance protein CopC [Streptomyces kaniharaensis]|uniref:Copper resistance protein CopC n=1 Tax=Streptomyces kaniharaensis TaxID=212423 RepID=A0A6N7KK69_9ACTN|nr:copper resistance CopC family protein [Streptomyces kaniharaensis]MQS10747.1 copper resistance protein CopC [Streptomyces kaniharaensis]
MTLAPARPARRAGGSAPPAVRSFQRRMATGVAALVVLLVAVGWLSSSEPVRLKAATPADGGSVQSPPAEVALAFTGELRPRSVFVRVTGENGVAVDGSAPRVDGQRVITPVSISRTGAYLVTYRLALAGGGEVSGVTGFSVGSGAAGPQGDTGAVSGPSGHGAHDHGVDGPWNIALLCLDALLLPGAVLLMIRRPRVRRGRARPKARSDP